MALNNMVGSSAPFKVFDPLGFAAKADQATLNKYRESELKHGELRRLLEHAALGGVVWAGVLVDAPALRCAFMPQSGVWETSFRPLSSPQ